MKFGTATGIMPLDMLTRSWLSIHVPLAILPTCMYGGSTADVYENNGMKNGHKSHPLLINSFISLHILYMEDRNIKTKDWYA